jgi:hypothetical protein
MAKQTINIGASPNDGTGTPLRTSFDYCNLNFTELYTATGPSGNNIVVPGTATITGDLTVGTNALIAFPATNRVLINQSAAIQGDALEISAKSDGGTISLFGRASDNGATLTFRANGTTTQKASIVASDSGLSIRTGTVERYNIDTTGVSTWSVAGTTAMTLNSTGNLVLKGGTVGANGVGVAFPATQVASSDANCLDDYEEGTFTPTITASAGTLTTTTVNGASYTKIGRLVSVQVDISIVNVGTASGQLFFSLPFSQGTDFNVGVLRELGATGNNGQISYQSATTAYACFFGNGTLIVNGYRIRGTYTYTV